jgi:hypothetical protein
LPDVFSQTSRLDVEHEGAAAADEGVDRAATLHTKRPATRTNTAAVAVNFVVNFPLRRKV